jgi:hypothetical protein
MSQQVTTSTSIPDAKIAAKVDFIVNEFPRIRVPAKKTENPQDFSDMSKIQRQLIVKRLIEHVNEI